MISDGLADVESFSTTFSMSHFPEMFFVSTVVSLVVVSEALFSFEAQADSTIAAMAAKGKILFILLLFCFSDAKVVNAGQTLELLTQKRYREV